MTKKNVAKKIKHSDKTADKILKNKISRVLFIPNEPVEEYYKFKQTYNMYPFKYFDLLGSFDEVYFSYLSPEHKTDKKIGKFYIQKVKRTNIFKNKFVNYLNIIDYIRFINRTVKLIRKYDIQLIRAYNNQIEGFLASIIGKITKVPVVISVHNDLNYEKKNTPKSDVISYFIINNIQRILEFFSNRMSTKIFCVSNHLKKDIIEKNHVNASKIEVIFNKVEMEKFQRVDKKAISEIIKKYDLKDKKIFLFLGRFVWQKNIFTMLEAFKQVVKKDQKSVLLMLSDGPQKEDIERFIEENNLKDNVKLLGFISNDTLPHFMKLSSVFVLPSLYEGFGIILIEAQASGCPVIVSDIPSVKDITNENNSWIFEPKDTRRLANLMMMFLDEKNRKNNKSSKNNNQQLIERKRVQALKDVQRFKWETLATNEIRLYNEIVESYNEYKNLFEKNQD